MKETMVSKMYKNRMHWQMWLRLISLPFMAVLAGLVLVLNWLIGWIDKLPRVPK